MGCNAQTERVCAVEIDLRIDFALQNLHTNDHSVGPGQTRKNLKRRRCKSPSRIFFLIDFT